MKITNYEDYVLLENDAGSYHLSHTEFKRLGKKQAIELAKREIEKKNAVEFKDDVINYDIALSMGFCKQGLWDFAEELDLDIEKTYRVAELEPKLTLEVMFRYPDEILKVFGYEAFKKREREIAKSPCYSYRYAFDVLKGRFEMGEPEIAKDEWYAYFYALHVLKGRFELGEPAIAKDAEYSYKYALKVLKSRFLPGEPAINKDARWREEYSEFLESLEN